MPRRKFSHHRRITSKTRITIGGIRPGNIIEFAYNKPTVYDKKPLIFVLRSPFIGKVGAIKSENQMIHGVNLNYLYEYQVQKLLLETNYRKLRYYTYYKHAFRSYFLKKINHQHIVEYLTDADKLDLLREQKNKAKKE